MKEQKIKCILKPYIPGKSKNGAVNWKLTITIEITTSMAGTPYILVDELEDGKRGNIIHRYFTTRPEAVQYMMSKLKETADTLQEYNEAQRSNLIATIYEDGSFSVIGEDNKDVEDE